MLLMISPHFYEFAMFFFYVAMKCPLSAVASSFSEIKNKAVGPSEVHRGCDIMSEFRVRFSYVRSEVERAPR
jgi:hypothetical protein